jgi:hypothetical protein
VKLYFMIPPIAKMDPAALSTLKSCEHLALSSNSIDKIANLGGIDNLRILSVGRNNIRKLENMDAIADRLEVPSRPCVAPHVRSAPRVVESHNIALCCDSAGGGTVQELWMSYNPISSLGGIEKLRKLRVLYMGNCKVELPACPLVGVGALWESWGGGARAPLGPWLGPTPAPTTRPLPPTQVADKKEFGRLQELPVSCPSPLRPSSPSPLRPSSHAATSGRR